MKIKPLFTFSRFLLAELALFLGGLCSLLATLFGDIEESLNDSGDSDLTGTTGVSLSGMREPITYTDNGEKIGLYSGTPIDK